MIFATERCRRDARDPIIASPRFWESVILRLHMRYCEIKPQPQLRRFVECFWTLASDESVPNASQTPILPDGCVELILNCGAPFEQTNENGERTRQPAYFLVGQMTRPVLIAPTGFVELIGIRFHPGGTMPFLKQPLHELTNRIIELGGLDSSLESELRDALKSSPALSGRINAIESCLTRRAAEGFTCDNRLLELAANAVRLSGRITIDRLANSAGISSRQLERRFLTEVGLGPKLFCRILRFQEVFRAVAENPPGWAELALDCGYYDQAHLIRDFQEFAHQTPAVQLAQSGGLTEAFTRRYRSTTERFGTVQER
jgi:AraC-like DNA-binding protein